MNMDPIQARPAAAIDPTSYFLDLTVETIARLDRSAIDAVIERLFRAWREGRTVFVMGNGGSASTASHFAADLAKYTVIAEKARFRVMALTDNAPLVSAWTNDSGFNSIFEQQLVPWLAEGDVLVGFSVHGGSGSGSAGQWSQNMVAAMELARERGASIIGFSGYDGGRMAELAEHCLTVPALDDPLGTPLIESIHVLLHHLIVHSLRARILNE